MRSAFKVKWVVAAVGLCVFAGLAFAVVSGNWQIRPILSGSMEPGFPVGGVAVTQRMPISDLQLRSVIVTHPPGQPHFDLIHRIVQIKSQTADTAVVQTMGDANSAPDPFTVRVYGPWIYRVRFTVPLIGYPALWAHSHSGRLIVFACGLLLAFAGLLRSLFGRSTAKARSEKQPRRLHDHRRGHRPQPQDDLTEQEEELVGVPR